MIQQVPFWVFIQRGKKHELEKIHASQYSSQCDLQRPRIRKQRQCPSADAWINTLCVCVAVCSVMPSSLQAHGL